VNPSPEEIEAMIRAGGFDEFGESRTRQFWEAQRLVKNGARNLGTQPRCFPAGLHLVLTDFPGSNHTQLSSAIFIE
jgi:hypothetical protein